MSVLPSSKPIIKITVPLLLMLVISSLGGMFIPNIYSKETPSWAMQAQVQDFVNLFVLVPTMLVSMLFLRRSRMAIFVWMGAMIYAVYTFLIYCFAVHFNALFLVYCWTLGLSVYGLILMAIRLDFERIAHWHFRKVWLRIASGYLMVISVLFYILWLVQVVPALYHSDLPAGLKEVGTWTNPVHVIDLSIILPAMFVSGILLLRHKALGHLFAPALLVFTIIMEITIGSMMAYQTYERFTTGYTMALLFAALAVISAVMFVRVAGEE